MDKLQYETLRFLHQQDKTCKVDDIRKVVAFRGSNWDFLDQLFLLYPKYIVQKQDRLTITEEGRIMLLEEETRLSKLKEKEELEMVDKNKYHINVGDGSIANVIIGSPHASISNKSEIIKKVRTIIKTVENDNSVDNTIKQQAIGDLSQFIIEVEQGKPKRETVDKLLTLGANIASIGSLVISLIQMIALH